MLRVISVPLEAIPDVGKMPEGTTVIGVHCAHLERALFTSFPPPGSFPLLSGLAQLFGAEDPTPGERGPVMTATAMKHAAVASWGEQLTCGCAEPWWAQHGPRYQLVPEGDEMHCPHDGSAYLSLAHVERN
jgi:hypothetical protein